MPAFAEAAARGDWDTAGYVASRHFRTRDALLRHPKYARPMRAWLAGSSSGGQRVSDSGPRSDAGSLAGCVAVSRDEVTQYLDALASALTGVAAAN